MNLRARTGLPASVQIYAFLHERRHAAVDCAARLTRGANWGNPASFTRVAYRYTATWNVYRASNAGIRIGRTL